MYPTMLYYHRPGFKKHQDTKSKILAGSCAGYCHKKSITDVILFNPTVLSQLGVRSSSSHQELSGDPQYAIIAPRSLMMPVALLPLAVIVPPITVVMPLCRAARHRCRAACRPAAPYRLRATRRCRCAAPRRAGGHLAAPCPGWPFSVAAIEGFCLIHYINGGGGQ